MKQLQRVVKIMSRVMKQYKVYELLTDYIPTEPVENDPFSINVITTVKDGNGNEHTVTLAHYSCDTIISEMLEHYAEWQYTMYYIDSRYNSHNNPIADFTNKWLDYKNENMENWRRICDAYNMVYNPIHNYDRIEDGSTNNNDTVGSSNNSTNTFEQLNDTTTTHDYNPNSTDGISTEYYSTTYDDTTNPKLTGKNNMKGVERTTTNNGSTQTTYANTANTEQSSNGTHHLEVRGNIGVTTTQQMIESEMNLRKFNFLQYIIDGFADYALNYSPESEDDYDSYFLYL